MREFSTDQRRALTVLRTDFPVGLEDCALYERVTSLKHWSSQYVQSTYSRCTDSKTTGARRWADTGVLWIELEVRFNLLCQKSSRLIENDPT